MMVKTMLYAKVTPQIQVTGKVLYVVTYEGDEAATIEPKQVYFPHVEDADLYADAVNRGEVFARG